MPLYLDLDFKVADIYLAAISYYYLNGRLSLRHKQVAHFMLFKIESYVIILLYPICLKYHLYNKR